MVGHVRIRCWQLLDESRHVSMCFLLCVLRLSRQKMWMLSSVNDTESVDSNQYIYFRFLKWRVIFETSSHLTILIIRCDAAPFLHSYVILWRVTSTLQICKVNFIMQKILVYGRIYTFLYTCENIYLNDLVNMSFLSVFYLSLFHIDLFSFGEWRPSFFVASESKQQPHLV